MASLRYDLVVITACPGVGRGGRDDWSGVDRGHMTPTSPPRAGVDGGSHRCVRLDRDLGSGGWNFSRSWNFQ